MANSVTSLRTGQAPIYTREDWSRVLCEPTTQRFDPDADLVVGQLDSTVQLNLRSQFTWKMAVALTGGGRYVPALHDYAVQLHRGQLEQHGDTTDCGLERWPVCWIDFTQLKPEVKDLDGAVLGFFGHTRTRSLPDRAAAGCLRDHGTRLLVLAGLSGHATKWTTKPRLWLKAHLIDLADVAPVTVVLVGSDLEKLFHGDDPHTRQLSSRTKLLGHPDDFPRPKPTRIRRPGDPLSPDELELRNRLIAYRAELTADDTDE